VAVLLSPIVSAWSVITGDPKPRIFAWLYTHDASLDGGQSQHPDQYKPGARGVALWWQRMFWICRNPAYGFAAYVIGLPVEGTLVAKTTLPDGWKNLFFDKATGKHIGFGYRRQTKKLDIWLGWAAPSHDGKRYMLKIKVRNRS
jgi:hypothetical protein